MLITPECRHCGATVAHFGDLCRDCDVEELDACVMAEIARDDIHRMATRAGEEVIAC